MRRQNWKVATSLACVLLLPCAARCLAQPPSENPLHTASRAELDVVKAVLAQEKAWNGGDLDGYVTGYKDSPDTLFIGRRSRTDTPRF